MTSTSTLTASVDELRFRLHGGLHEPGDSYYEDSRTLFNTMINRRPRYVAECLAVDDVVAALAFARGHDLPVAVRAGGHSVAGLSLCDDGLVLDVRGMADIDVDPGRRIARVGGGARWADLDRATQAHGLATTGGRVSTTGVAGLTLGGGSGWLERKHGLACDNLLAAELVCWDGRIVRASSEENPELLWALRGGGGSFGVVTALELALYPLGPEVFAGVALFAAHRAQQVLRTFRNVMQQAPRRALPGLRVHHRARTRTTSRPNYGGARPSRSSACGRAASQTAKRRWRPSGRWARTQTSSAPPATPTSSARWTTRPATATTGPPRTSPTCPTRPSTLWRGARPSCRPVPRSCSSWPGAARSPAFGPQHSPLAGRDAGFIVHPLLLWEDPADDERNRALARAFRTDLRPWSTGATYPNFLGDEGSQRMRAAYGTSTERLAAVKADWDPHGVFRTHQNIQ